MIWKELLDQFLHIAVGFIVTIVAVDGWLPGGFVGLSIGLVREQAQMRDSFDRTIGPSRILDISMWTAGGMLGGLI